MIVRILVKKSIANLQIIMFITYTQKNGKCQTQYW